MSRGASATPVGRRARASASLIETLFTLAVLAALAPFYVRLATLDAGAQDRFAVQPLAVSGLPEPVLPKSCARARYADPALLARLCRDTDGVEASDRMPEWFRELDENWRQVEVAFSRPLREARARLDDLLLRQREGVGDVLALSEDVAAMQAALKPYVEHYALPASAASGPRPLACAVDAVRAALQGSSTTGRDSPPMHNALLLLAAAMDGDRTTSQLSGIALLPTVAATTRPDCRGETLATLLPLAATLMSDARRAVNDASKNAAMQTLMRSAGWQWAAAMLIGLSLLKLSRSQIHPANGVAIALASWAFAAWLARVSLPFADAGEFVPARAETSLASAPHFLVLALLALATAIALWARLRPSASSAAAAQTVASRVGFAGFAAMTGLGWLLLLDLSANAHAINRYLALYHQGHLWLALLVLTVLAFARQRIARALAWTLAVAGDFARSVGRRAGAVKSAAALGVGAAVLVALVVATWRGVPQLTSELGRIWIVAGAAWFFHLRATPLTEQLARGRTPAVALLRYLWPLAAIALVLVAAMMLTADMGPLLVSVYAAGAFLAASIAGWRHQRGAGRLAAIGLAALLFVVWIAVVTAFLFRFGALGRVTGARLESVLAPLAAVNDQLALVSWFQSATPLTGYGIGQVPWCGHVATSGCGIPAQIQSDYTFTAIYGAFGAVGAWCAAIGCALWLHRLVLRHTRVTSGEPRLVRGASGVTTDHQAFLSWLCVCWVVLTLCQLAVTVAGNVAVLPLTGVTFPFVSYGMTAAVVNAAFLGLCLSVTLPGGGRHE